MTSVVRLAHLYLWADRNTTKCGDNVLPACLCVSGDPRALLPTRTHLARAGRHAIPQQNTWLLYALLSTADYNNDLPFPDLSLRTVSFLTGCRFTQPSEYWDFDSLSLLINNIFFTTYLKILQIDSKLKTNKRVCSVARDFNVAPEIYEIAKWVRLCNATACCAFKLISNKIIYNIWVSV